MNDTHGAANPVNGLVISRGQDDDFKRLISKHDEISYLDLEDLGFE